MEYSQVELKKAAQALSERYRTGATPFLRTRQDRYAYLLTRWPATKAALHRVFQEIQRFPIESILDIGAGPGTSWSAAEEIWNVKLGTFVEKDPDFVQIGKERTPKDRTRWVTGDAGRQFSFEPHDLVLFSYSWGEILNFAVLESAWRAAKKFLVVVEPGTPKGYKHMLAARDHCIAQKGVVYAPCPHSLACPWKGTEEWCHFGVRLERTDEHRLAKEGSLGYEDEKFSYVILSKEGLSQSASRLLRDPSKRKGHTIVTLCTTEGIKQKTVTKKDKELYKAVNKLRWGSQLPLPLQGENYKAPEDEQGAEEDGREGG